MFFPLFFDTFLKRIFSRNGGENKRNGGEKYPVQNYDTDKISLGISGA